MIAIFTVSGGFGSVDDILSMPSSAVINFILFVMDQT